HRDLVRPLAREFHPSRCRPQRRRHLSEAPAPGRDRASDDALRPGDGAPHHRGHPRGEPQAGESAADGSREAGCVIRELAIVGVALLGGSEAKAARAGRLARRLVGIGRDAGRLSPALEDGTLNAITTDLAEGVRTADFVLLAAPVLAIEGLLAEIGLAAPAGAVVTDVGSTKRNILRAAARLSAQRPPPFVGRRRLAGSGQGSRAATVWRAPMCSRASRSW